MFIGPQQFLCVFVFITALAGFWRGWLREMITLSITLASVLFLLNGGILWLWDFLFFRLPAAFNELFTGNTQASAVEPHPPAPNPYGTFFLDFSFIILVGMGYIIGHRYGGTPKLLISRVSGFVMGAINGVVIMFYVTKQLFWGGSLTAISPNAGDLAIDLPAALGFGLVCVAVLIIATGVGRGGGH